MKRADLPGRWDEVLVSDGCDGPTVAAEVTHTLRASLTFSRKHSFCKINAIYDMLN